MISGLWRDLGGSFGAFELLWGLVAFAVTIGFWALVIMLIVRLVKGSSSMRRSGAGMQILEERYARGEITRDEFLERKVVLNEDS